jgi:hypothetical protein
VSCVRYYARTGGAPARSALSALLADGCAPRWVEGLDGDEAGEADVGEGGRIQSVAASQVVRDVAVALSPTTKQQAASTLLVSPVAAATCPGLVLLLYTRSAEASAPPVLAQRRGLRSSCLRAAREAPYDALQALVLVPWRRRSSTSSKYMEFDLKMG